MGFGAPLATKAGSFKVICKLDTAIPVPTFDFDAALAAAQAQDEATQVQAIAAAFLATPEGQRSAAQPNDFKGLDTRAARLVVVSLLARDRWRAYVAEGDNTDLALFKPWAEGEDPPIIFTGCHLTNPEKVYIRGQLARPAEEGETEEVKQYRLGLWVLAHCLRGVQSGWPGHWPAPQRTSAGLLDAGTLDCIPEQWVPLLAAHFIELAEGQRSTKKG